MENPNSHAMLLTGTLSNVTKKNTTAEIFFRSSDSDGMAATGAVAAALGLSGAAVGMAAMSMDEMKEPVCQLSFDIDGRHVEALLWNWPFKNGDEVQVVAEPAPNGGYTGFAVLDPKERIIVLYPHVSAGRKSHWKNVLKLSLLVGISINLVMCALMIFIYLRSKNIDFESIFIIASTGSLGVFAIFLWIGYGIGKRFLPFIEMAEPIFTLLGWNDVKNVDLRKITKAKKKPTDPPAMGDSYFRY
ncbi:putative type VI secretion system effector [Xanthomonas oryzae]|uniref:Type VI secretion system effector n=2 Tax=Xanthomonas oryzae TaxID=347 RepID=A0AAJ6GU25_9XANT|nr:putative type VI secretion system effector [Xanthomonas oryzae]WIX06189.1 putative type VI secretion system effector [Xanthomonas oryzae pv. oryzae]